MKRILLVDNQKEIRDLLSRFFLLNGYEVESVEDGEAAMRLVKKKQYDLVVADFLMPKMDGLNLTKQLKLGLYNFSCFVKLSPSILGIKKSATTRSYCFFFTSLMAASPSSTLSTSYPFRRKNLDKRSLISFWLSTSKILFISASFDVEIYQIK